MNSSTVPAFVSMMHSISTFPAASLTAIEMLAWCTSMPIYFLLSIWVLLSVGREPTPQAYFERGALFYNALTRLRVNEATGRTGEGNVAGTLYLADRHRARLRIFQPCTFFQQASPTRRNNAERIPSKSQ